MGEHAVVYGRPAVVAAVGLRLTVTLTSAPGNGVRICLPAVQCDRTLGWNEILAYTREVAARWREFAADPGAESFERVRRDDPAHVVVVALGAAFQHCGYDARAIEIHIDSEIPVGCGFGSSSAAAVAIVAAYLLHADHALDPAVVDRLAFEVERSQHGLPSGVDHRTVIRGGVQWATRQASGELALARLFPSPPTLSHLAILDTGPPAEGTGAVVAAVRDRIDGSPRRFEELLDRMGSATERFRKQLTANDENPQVILATIHECECCLEELGVVPEPVRLLVRRIEREGGAAKISGAGALTGSGAGCLLVYHPSADWPSSWGFLAPYPRHAVLLGAEGLRPEA